MWRSWVDRINTVNKNPCSDDHPAMSPEELHQRAQKQANLRDLFNQSQDLLMTESERSDIFLSQVLPAYCAFYDADPGPHVFETFYDIRTFIVVLARHLVSGIRSVPDTTNKTESSKVLMDNLRSKLHLYYVLKAINISTFGPNVLVTVMLQQRVPSVVIKLFRSFIDLPRSYYDTETKQGVSDSMVTLEDAGNVVVDTLKQCVKNPSVLTRLIVEDTFFLLLRLILAKPAEWIASPNDGETQEPGYMVWKHKALEILRCAHMNWDAAQYLYLKRWITMPTQLWRENIDKSRLGMIEYYEILISAELIYLQLKMSIEVDFLDFYNELEQLDIYDTLAAVLVSGPFRPVLDLKIKLSEILVKFVYIGRCDRIPTAPDGLPYQHSDFVLPEFDITKDQIIRNAPAFQSLLSAFIYPSAPSRAPIKSRQTNPVPVELRDVLFEEMRSIIQAHPINYFIIERLNTLPLLIETMENYDENTQKGIMDLISYVMCDLNFVPLKELAVLSLHLQTGSSGKIISLICKHLTMLLRKSPKFLTVIREAGLINVMSLMLSDVTEKLNESSSHKEKETQLDPFVEQVVENFDTITECLVEMTKDSNNVSIFRKTYRGNLFDLLNYPKTRTCALRLFECLSSHNTGKTDTISEDGSPDSPTSEFVSSIEVGHTFSRMMEAIQAIPRNDLEFRLEVLKTIQRIFITHPSTRDIFRKVGGYVSLVSMIVSLEGAFSNPVAFSADGKEDGVLENIILVIQKVFVVLVESMRNHEVNKAYFANDVGYGALENALIMTGALDPEGIPHRILGMIMAFAVQDKRVLDLFVPPKSSGRASQIVTTRVYQKVEETLNDLSVSVVNPHITPSMLHLQKKISYDQELSTAVYVALLTLSKSSRRNQVKLNKCGLLLTALQLIFPRQDENDTNLAPFEKSLLTQIVKKLMIMGVSDEELRYIFQGFGSDTHLANLEDPSIAGLMELIIQGVTSSRWPNFIQFDMNTYGYASLEIPNLQNFPPNSSGYTWMAWVHVEQFDDTAELILFTVWDDKKLVFKIFLDPKTHKLRVMANNKQEAIFDSFDFQPGFCYHVSFVHSRSRLGPSFSTITLYVNGVLVEQTRCQYLAYPSGSSIVRGVLGTPRELAPSKSRSRLVWDLGPCYLIQETLEADVLSLYFHLGAQYRSLFQDGLRQFQTYEASTALFLNLRNISKTFSRREMTHNSLVSVMRGSISSPLAESKILFAFFSCNAISEGTRTGLISTGLSEATKKLITSDPEYQSMVLNAAFPKLEDAIFLHQKMGHLDGHPVLAYPFGLDEAIWKIGGCAVALKLIERSETSATLCKTTSILFEMIRYSWRNSEDMERSRGYEIFAYLLKQKRDLISPELLELLLVFVGKNSTSPEESVINNPFAYRYVILNFEIWKKTHLDVQRAHLAQFILFLYSSKRRQFNLKRLQKVHLVKKMLLSFRMNIYAKELIPYVVEALKAVMLSSWNTENIRAVATFLASTVSKVSKEEQETVQKPLIVRTNSSASLYSETGGESSDERSSSHESKDPTQAAKVVQMRNIVLEMLHYILCDGEDNDIVHKFASTITNKWPLLFFAPNINAYTIVLAARILARLLVSQGGIYVAKFRGASEGFLVMSKLLPRYWNLAQLQETLVIIMLGADVMEFPINPLFDINRLKLGIKSSQPKISIPDVLLVIIALWKQGARAMTRYQDKAGSSLPAAMYKSRMRSGSVGVSAAYGQMSKDVVAAAHVQEQFIRLFNEMYSTRPDFKHACRHTDVIDDMVEIMFNAVCNTESLKPEEELAMKDSNSLILDTDILPESSPSSPISKDSILVDVSDSPSILKRGGSSQLVTKTSPHVNKRTASMLTRFRSASMSSEISTPNPPVNPLRDTTLEALLEFIVNISVDSITDPLDKNLTGLNLVITSFPPSTTENQTTFESYLMTHISQSLKSSLQLESELLEDNRVLTNVARFCQIASDAVLQGRFMNGAEQTYDLLASVLESLNTNNTSSRYGPSENTITMLYRAFNRMILLKISELEQGVIDSEQISAFLGYCIHHQKIILSPKNTDMEFLRCLCYHLYQFLMMHDDNVRADAANFWKLLILQKYDAIASIFKVRVRGIENDELIDGFRHMLEMDTDSFFVWIDSRKLDLNLLFKEHIYKTWENVITQENKYSRETMKNSQIKRINKLKKLQKRQMYQDEVLQDYLAKTKAWSKSIQEVEVGRFTKALQDNDGHENLISSEWVRISADLTRDRAIWGTKKDSESAKWRLDYTECRHRMRKKIQRIETIASLPYLPKQTNASSSETQGASIGSEMNPTGLQGVDKNVEKVVDEQLSNSPVSIKSNINDDIAGDDYRTSNEEDTKQSEEEDEDELSYEEDKNRKVIRLLDQNDMVIDVYNISQISGLDAREGLLLLCKNNIYLIDNFFQRADGEVVEIWKVPRKERDEYLILVAQAAGMETEPTVSLDGDMHNCRKWANTDLKEIYKRRFLFRDVALELFFADGQNALLTVSLKERDELYTKLASRVTLYEDSTESIIGAGEKEYLTNTLSGAFKLSNLFGTSILSELTQRWERRDITNFQYLMYLNTVAGRSYNDLTQYPVFPWILADYTSEDLNLENPDTFRDLSKPMGAQTSERRLEFADRYRQWGETNDPAPAFHYGTHYSSAMIVCSFLIRLEPFTQHYLKLQGGTFDHADRLFDSIGKAWESASEKNMGDVRELIPEFFYLPEFLENVNKFNFGVKQGTGEAIDSVVLPPWAHGDPKVFIMRHREALESDYVSANLHHWIDLIFGFKQQGQAAIDALNVFHHVSYEGAVDLDKITDVVEKTATIGIINNFGQTPRQLFKKPHPTRMLSSTDVATLGFYPFQDHTDKLVQSIRPVKDIKHQVGDAGLYNDRLGVSSNQQLFIPSDGQRYIEWGFTDFSLRLFSSESGKLLNVFEKLHVGYISTACFPDSRTLVTGGTDSMVCMWKVKADKGTDFIPLECLRGHTSSVTALTASRSNSILVSGSEDKSAIVWDLNRMKYVRSLMGHENGVQLVCINDSTGDIITCSGHVIRVWTINGELLLSKSTGSSSEPILSCVFYEERPKEWSGKEQIITGHKKGIIKFWIKEVSLDPKTGRHRWNLTLVRQIQQMNRTHEIPDVSDIVLLKFTGPKRTLLSGNTLGQVYSYVLPDTTDTVHYVKEDRCRECMFCTKTFSVLERKNHCRTCGGIFCSGCLSSVSLVTPDRSTRFCKSCFEELYPLY